jgi:hypothetical protein
MTMRAMPGMTKAAAESVGSGYRLRSTASSARRRCGDLLLLGGFLLAVALGVLAVVLLSLWLMEAAVLALVAGFMSALLCWAGPFDADGEAERIVSDWRGTSAGFPMADWGSANAPRHAAPSGRRAGEESGGTSSWALAGSNYDPVALLTADIRVLLERERRKSLLLQWGFFVLGVAASIVVQKFF